MVNRKDSISHSHTPKDAAQLKSGWRAHWMWLCVFALVWVFDYYIEGILSPYWFSILMYAGMNVVLAVSLNLVNGFTGQFSMGHAGFMSVGAYASAFITLKLQAMGWGDLQNPLISSSLLTIGLLVGGIIAALAGYVVGLPSLRLKGDYLAIVTLGFGEIIRVIVLNIETLGGARGLPGIPKVATFGWVFTWVVVTVFCVWRLVYSPHGREMLSVREDEIAAEAMGVNTTKAKVRAFVVAAFFAGIAGGLLAHYLTFVSPQMFDFNRSFEAIIMVVLGGMGSITGSVLAALFLTGMKEVLRDLQEITKVDFRMIIYSLALILLMLTRPNGLFGTKEFFDFLPDRLRKRFTDKERIKS